MQDACFVLSTANTFSSKCKPLLLTQSPPPRHQARTRTLCPCSTCDPVTRELSNCRLPSPPHPFLLPILKPAISAGRPRFVQQVWNARAAAGVLHHPRSPVSQGRDPPLPPEPRSCFRRSRSCFRFNLYTPNRRQKLFLNLFFSFSSFLSAAVRHNEAEAAAHARIHGRSVRGGGVHRVSQRQHGERCQYVRR
jgi:hypothetical protein